MTNYTTTNETTKPVRAKMTAEDATTFDGYSQGNALALVAASKARGCQCAPYVDWFTYNRWLAQGMQVQKGEKSAKILVVVSAAPSEEGKAARTFPKTASVFCRCQVKPAGPTAH